ncbi:MAG: 4-amino-4-deoxy-L-arabinose transferase [Actinomycetota bacterium]|nr:4-amino-4-deoxy-L-arabinose transferase [Actinomycetota bacterium]
MRLPDVVTHIQGSPGRLGSSRLVCIDGRAGAGKSDYADELAGAWSAATSIASTTLHMDDLYEGWGGLPEVAEVVSSMLMEPWNNGRDARPAAWDWGARRRGAPTSLPLTPLVILEGVGSYARRYGDLVTTVIWLECPDPVRRSRALARDGAVFAPHWDRWARDEVRVHTREDTRARADVTVYSALERPSAVVGPVLP